MVEDEPIGVTGGEVSFRPLRLLIFSLILAHALNGSASSQAKKPFDVGPKVGQRVPEFRLEDHSGNFQTLQTLKGSNGLVLVFFRSADW